MYLWQTRCFCLHTERNHHNTQPPNGQPSHTSVIIKLLLAPGSFLVNERPTVRRPKIGEPSFCIFVSWVGLTPHYR